MFNKKNDGRVDSIDLAKDRDKWQALVKKTARKIIP
jgi:hypothetical protein